MTKPFIAPNERIADVIEASGEAWERKDQPAQTWDAIDRHKAAQQILCRLAPEDPINQDERGGCMWCGRAPPGRTYGYAGRYRSDHSVDCPWLEAREFLGDHIEDKRK